MCPPFRALGRSTVPAPRVRAVALLASVLVIGCTSSPTIPPSAQGDTGGPCAVFGGAPRTLLRRIPERGTSTTLEAQVWAPDAARQTAPCPMITMLPGGGADISSVSWAAERLAAAGYVVVVTVPSSGGSVGAYHIAAMSGIDWLASAANPYRTDTDTGRVGAAGWSLGARALTRTQAEDPRVDAIVAWDNLAVRESGDEGSAACTFVPGPARPPRVPALGQASESCPTGPPSTKLTAFEHWRAAGIPVVQVVFAGATHFWWSGSSTTAQRDLSHAYTRAWFDRWLKADTALTGRAFARTVPGLSLPVPSTLSTRFRSAVAVDGYYCGDLQAGC